MSDFKYYRSEKWKTFLIDLCYCGERIGNPGGICKCGGAIPGPGEPGYKRLEAGQCCEKAYRIECVCYKAWDCPDHGQHHVGSHD